MNMNDFIKLADTVSATLGVDTTTIYRQDPRTDPKLYRLLWMKGVEDEAPMYGPIYNGTLGYQILTGGDAVLPVLDVFQHPLFKESTFAIREGIKSTIRFKLPIGVLDMPIIFFGYRTPQSFERELEKLQVAIGTFKGIFELLPNTGNVNEGLPAYLWSVAADLMHLLGVQTANLVQFWDIMERILRRTLEATGVGERGYACVHMVETDWRTDQKFISCRCRVRNGQFKEGRSDRISLNDRSITAKVARDEKGLLLRNVDESCGKYPERYQYKSHTERPRMYCELAVPIFTPGFNLKAVLNVEAPYVGAFEPQHVPILEFFANIAGIAIDKWGRWLGTD